MGGKQNVKKLCHGVAEHLNYYTEGKIEKAAKSAKQTIRKFFALPVGTVYITGGCGLHCKSVYHAVTMRHQGSRSSYDAVKKCIENIFKQCIKDRYHSVAFPMLGCGTGGLEKEKVCKILKAYASEHTDLEIMLFLLTLYVK